MKDYYKVLGIKPQSNSQTIKEAYRKLAKKYHPDRNHDTDTTTYMQQINDAYSVLNDPQKRKNYDFIYYRDIIAEYDFKDVSIKRRRTVTHPRVSEIEARNRRELQNILDRACIVLPNDKALHKLSELHREDPESCAYKFKQYKREL